MISPIGTKSTQSKSLRVYIFNALPGVAVDFFGKIANKKAPEGAFLNFPSLGSCKTGLRERQIAYGNFAHVVAGIPE